MKIHADITINGRLHKKGEHISAWAVYPFFLVHMLMFGGSGFFLAYMDALPDVMFLYMHGGIAVLVYTIFYLTIFGLDQVKWMFINAVLGLYGIYVEIDLILAQFGKAAADFPVHVHVIPFLYYILYTFLLRQMLIDVFGVRDDPERLKRVNAYYVAGSTAVYTLLLFS